MSEQAGYNKVTFYERKSLIITYSGVYITNITTSGDTIVINDYDFSNISVDFDFVEAENNDVLLDIKVKFQYNELSSANFVNVNKLMNSIYGFAAKLEGKNGSTWFINSPFKFEGDEINTNESHVIPVEMQCLTRKSFEKLL